VVLTDRRAARVTSVRDETWLRVVDAQAALAARRYTGGESVTVAVDDPLLPHNSAAFTVTGDGAQPTDRPARLRVGAEGLAAVLLGGTSWRSLAVAGLARTDDPEALATADRLFAVDDAPHAGFFF
jgi:predicted acetyltransferase